MVSMTTRRYNTSCGPCRRSRIGCDAPARRPRACTNCARRGKMCESAGRSRPRPSIAQGTRRSPDVDDSAVDVDSGFDAIAIAESPKHVEFGAEMPSPSPLPSPLNSPFLATIQVENMANKRTQWMQLHNTLWGIFHSVWDSRASLWLGNSCNPFLEASVGTNSSMSRIVIDADKMKSSREPGAGAKSPSARFKSSEEVAMNDCLRYAVYAFAARWLPFRKAFQIKHGTSDEEAQKMERDVRSYLWRRARSSMYAAMTRPCYRSNLALFLFCFTEMPMDNDDSGFGHLSCEMLFSHFNHMRSPNAHKKRWDALSEYTTVTPPSGVQNPVSTEVENLRDSMFWLAVICDSTRSMLQLSSSVVLPGRSGDAKVWDRIRQRNAIFDKSFRCLHGSAVPLSDDVVSVVLQHSVACKTMHIGMINQFFDAVFHNKSTPESVEDAAQRVLDECNRFNDSLNHLLALCARDFSTLAVGNKLTYILTMAHYHLGTLVLCDVCDTLDTVPEPLEDPKLSRLYATNAIINAISLALNYDRYVESDSPHNSILLMDPTPITMIEAMSRTAHAVFSLLEANKIISSTAQMMISVVVSALASLSQISDSASFALTSIDNKCAKFHLRFNPKTSNADSPAQLDAGELELLGQCDRGFLDEFFQEMKIVDAVNGNLLLEQTVEKHEELLALSSATPISPSFLTDSFFLADQLLF